MPSKKRTATTTTTTNGDDNHDSRTGSRRTERVARECTYSDFLKCQPLNFKVTEGVVGVRRQAPPARECTYQDFMKCKPLDFKGTEGVVKLTKWFETMETVFHISNCTVEKHIKFATCTLLESALTWWNSHVKTVGPDVAYAMAWTDLKKKMTDKYYKMDEIKKLEVEL
nr:hypothetical protein [Tanacetum cinerariifolium]